MDNKLTLLLTLIIFSTYVKAQDVIFTNYSKDYISSEIVLNDGTVLNGYIKDFTTPKSFEFRTPAYDFSSIESKLNLDKKTFKFKKELKGIEEKLSLENIHSIVIMDSDTITYEKLKLKTINSNNEVIDLEREVMMPLIRRGEINLYGVNVYSYLNGSNRDLMYVLVYIKNPNQEFAYIPLDVNRVNLFNLGSVDDKFLKSFEEAGSDCPEFISYIENKRTSFEKKELRNEQKEKYQTFQNDKKAKLKLIKGSKNKKEEKNRLFSEYHLEKYTELIDAYSSRCKD